MRRVTPRGTIIIPAYNEQEGLPGVIEDIVAIAGDCEIIVVDDGSTDGTADIADRFGVRVIPHTTNRGKGAALRTGFHNARHDYIVWIDADGSYPATVIPEMLAALHTGFDGVVCSRALGRGNIPRFNRLGNRMFSILIRGIYGFSAQDPCTGLYAMRRHVLATMTLTSNRFAIEPEISIKAGRMGLRLLEIPIEYRPRIGDTKLNSIVVGFEDMWTIGKLLRWHPRTESKESKESKEDKDREGRV